MLNVISLDYRQQLTIQVNDHTPYLSPELEKEVEQLWQAECMRRGKSLFNGNILSAVSISPKEIHCHRVEYRRLIAQRARPELFNILKVRPLAVSGLLKCMDGIIFGRRADSLTQDKNLWELVPSGGLDANKIKINDNAPINYLSQLLIELREEVGISAEVITDLKPFCLVEDLNSHVVDIGISMASPLSFAAIRKNYLDLINKEYAELLVIAEHELNEFIQHTQSAKFVLVSLQLLKQYQLLYATGKQ